MSAVLEAARNDNQISKVVITSSDATLDDGKVVRRLGCFKDNEARDPFDASHGAISSSSRCAEAAAKAGHSFFGYEFGGHCFSSNTWQKATTLGNSNDCSMQAGGIPAGGAWAFDLYQMEEATKQAYANRASVDQAVPKTSVTVGGVREYTNQTGGVIPEDPNATVALFREKKPRF